MPDDMNFSIQEMADILESLKGIDLSNTTQLAEAHTKLQSLYKNAESTMDKMGKEIDKMELQLERKRTSLTAKVDSALKKNKEQIEKIDSLIRERVQNSVQYKKAYEKVLKSGAISNDDPAILELNKTVRVLTAQLKKESKEYEALLSKGQELMRQKEAEKASKTMDPEVAHLQSSINEIRSRKAALEREMDRAHKGLQTTSEAYYKVSEQKAREWDLKQLKKAQQAEAKRTTEAQAREAARKQRARTPKARTLYTPEEIASGKVAPGQTVYAPMKLMTKGPKGEPIHENVYTGITEEELVKKYHFTPAQAKKMAPKFTAEEYKKFLPKPSFTVSKMAGVPVGAKEYTGPASAGKKGTAYHTVAEMALEGWSVEDIIKEYRAKHYKQASRLTDEQFADLSGIKDISRALGGRKDKDQKALKAHLESFADMIKPLASSQGRSFIEQTLGGITNIDGKNVAWGGTFDAILGNILLDLKSNQNMSDKMGVQVNILKYLANLARSAGLDIPEIKGLRIAHQPAATHEGQIPVAQVHRVTEIADEDMAKYIAEIVSQMLEKEAGTRKAYNTRPFGQLKNLASPFTKTAFTTKEGKTVETWKDTNRGFLKQMLAEADSSEKIAELANYFRTNYAPEELSQVMRTLFAHSDDMGKQDKFTAGSFWEDKKHPENVEILRQRLSSLRKEMLPSASKMGVAGRISEENFTGDDEQIIDFIKLDGLNIGDWAVTYKTALEEQDEKLANSIVSYLASTIEEYFKDSGDTDSLKLGKKLADKIKDLSSEVTSEASEKVYDSLSQKVGEALGVDYSRKSRIDVDYTNATTAAKYYAPQIETAIDELGKMSSDDTEVIERRKEEQGMRDTFESMKAFTLADSYDENKLRRDAYESRKVKGDRLANWLYGMINQSSKVENLLRPYYEKTLQEAKVDETQVSFQDFVQKILADNPALYQQYRDSQKLQEMFLGGAGGQFGSLAVTQERALQGLEAIRQGIGGTSPVNLTQEMEAFYGAWENLEDSSDFDSLMLKYAMGEKPVMPEGTQMDLANSLFARMGRGEGARYYGKSDRMATDMPEQYAQEINAIQMKEEELVRLANETQDTLDANVRTLQDREEVYEKAIQELAISHFEKGVDINATRDLLSRPDVQRNYNERREALEEYRDLVGDSKAKLRIDKEGMAYEVSPIDYKEIEENFKGSILEEQFGSLEKYYAAIDDALEKFAAATERLVGNSSSPGQIWDTSSEVRKDRLRVLETMRKYDLEAQEETERQQATIEETKATEYAKIKIDALNRMQEIFAQEAAQRLASNKAYVSPDEETGSDEDVYGEVQEEEVKASQEELTTATIKRTQVEQEATKVDQQSTQALQDESEALKNKAEIARELISALEDKNKTEKEAIATDEKSTKSTRKRVAASETLKQRLANQKVREQIAESKAKEAAALSKVERGSGTKKQSAGEKEDYSKYAKNLKEITRAMLEREKIEKELNTTPSMLAKGRESREKLLIEYEGIIGKLTAQNELMIEQGRLSKEQVAQIEAEAQATRKLNSLKIQGQKGGAQSIFDVIKGGVKQTITRMFDYTGVYRVLNKIMASFQNIIGLSKELDTAMFNLRVVSGDSREEAKGLISDYNDLAKQLGATTVEIANAANEWMRQGYEAEQATKLITASTYLSKLGMIDAGQATQYLTSMIKGFKLEVTDAVEIVDKLTKLDMVSATSSGGLAEAMQNVASSAQLANVSMDKTLAYAATIIETTQRDESSVGMSLRTILARYGNVKAGAYSNMNLEATGDTDLENLNDVEKVLKKIGISIRSSATEFKSFEQVLDEVGDKWERLDSVSRNAIATAFAGQRQRESFLVLMNNMDRVEELAEISAEATGTATEKYSAYYETVEAATKRLQTAWENLSHSFETSGIIKGMTNFFAMIIDKAPQIIKLLATIATQMNAWKIPTLLKSGANASGLVALKQFSQSNFNSKQMLQYRYLSDKQNKQQSWKEKVLGESEERDSFGIKRKLNNVFLNIDNLVSALDRNTEAVSSQTMATKTQPTYSGGVSPTQYKEMETITDKSDLLKKIREPKFNLKNMRADKSKKKGLLGPLSGMISDQEDTQLTLEEAEQLKALKRKNAKTNAISAVATGTMSGVIGGIMQEGSTEAKAASGAVQGAAGLLGGIASIWIGPLGTMLGSVIGDVLGPIVANAVDKEANDRKKEVEKGQKQLDLLSSMDSSLSTLDSTSKIDQLSADDISSIRDIVNSIDEQMASEDSNLQNYLEGAFKAIKADKFFNNWETKLVTGTQEERRAITRALQLAKSEAETAAYESSMAEKKYAALTTAEAKVYYKKLDQAEVERAYIRSGVSEYSKYTLARKGVDKVIEEVAEQLEGVDLKGIRLYDSFGKLTEEADAYIRTMMKADDQMQEMLAGQTLTLQEAFSQENTTLLEQFSTALGVSIEQLGKFKETLGTLTLGDLLAGMGETREKMSSYNTLLTDFFSTGTISPENLENIIASFPDLINKIGEPQDLLRAVQTKVSQLGTQYVSAGISSWFSSEAVYEQFKEAFEGKEGFGAIFEKSNLLGDIKSLDEAKITILKMLDDDELKDKAQEMYDYIIDAGNAVQKELEYVKKQLEDTAELDAIMNVVDKNYEKQISALEEQKSALEQINDQREYENKLIEAKLKLENAQNEKKKVWREGVGWVYEADTSAIADAQKDLEDLENQKTIEELQAQIDELQAQRDYVADIPDRLELEQANENFKAWTDKLGLVNDDQLSVITKLQEVWTDLKTRSAKLEGEDQTKGQFDQGTQKLASASQTLMGIGGTAAAPTAGSAQANLQEAYEAVKKFDQSDNSQEAQTARTKFADALKNYQGAYSDYIGAGGTASKEQKQLNALQANSDDLRFAPKWEDVRFPGLSNKGNTFTYYASFEDVTDSPDSGWRQGKMKDVVLLGGINQRADEYGVKNFDELKNMNGQLFMNTEGVDQVFWAYDGHVYKASRHQEDWKATRNVKDDAPYYYSGKKSKGSGLTTADNNKFYYAAGTLSASGGVSMVNDDPQYGLEGIITPQGTLTALPSKSGVVPADMTRNVWQLGEVAPNLIKQLVDINGKFNSPLGFGTDESFNVDHLDVHMVAQPGFDMDDFVRKLRAARDLSKHS